MNLPNIEKFAQVFGGQMVAALNASGRKTLSGKANGQTVRSLPNLCLYAPDGSKFYLQGVVCRLNNWDDVWYSTAVKVGEKRADGTMQEEGDALNYYGVVPFNWKGDAGEDSRVDAMREFTRKVCIATDHSSEFHFEEAPKVSAPKVSKAPSMDALASLGLV
jgi:hypothetical protein